MHNISKDHCMCSAMALYIKLFQSNFHINVDWASNMMYRSGKGSPHSHDTTVDVVPTTAGIPSTLNLLPRA